MTLEEDEDIDLNPALPASGHQAGCEKQLSAKTKVQPALTRCAEIVAVIPIIILLLPVYTLIQVCVVAAGIYIDFYVGKLVDNPSSQTHAVLFKI